jgi:hypothetical protein
VDPYGCASDLSDWSDGGGAEEQGPAAAAPAAPAAWHGSNGSGSGGGADPQLRHAPPAWDARLAGPAAPAPEMFARRAAPGPGDLLPMLAAARLGPAAPWLAPDAARCYPQRTLAAGALAALQGDAAEGFVVDVSTGRLAVDPGVTTPELSPAALRALLQEFAEAGSAARALRHLSRRLCSGDSSGGEGGGGGEGAGGAPFGFPVTPCLRAFGAALGEQLAAQGAQLAALQQRLLLASRGDDGAGAAAGADAGALVAARRAASGCIERLHLLRSVADGVAAEVGGSGPQASATLLDCLYRRLAAGDPAPSGPAGEGAAGALLHLLLSSLMPLLAALGRWLYGGREGDSAGGGGGGGGAAAPGDDFFVHPLAGLPVQDPRFWSQAFALARGGGGGGGGGHSESSEGHADGGGEAREAAPAAEPAVSCPSFLAPLAEGILSAGKSLRLLRYMQQEELAAAPLQMVILEGGGAAPGGAWAGAGSVGWARPARGSGSPAREARRRSGWRGGRGAAAGGAAAAAAAAEAGPGGEAGGSEPGGVVRMSAAARLQLAVAAAAAAHGEDGEAFQLRFADAACALLRQWDAALPRAADADAAAAACGSPWQAAAGAAAPPPLLLLMPGGPGSEERGGWGGCAAGGSDGPLDGAPHERQQPNMLQALEAAGRLLRCPGSLLECGGAARQRAAAQLLLQGQEEAGADACPSAAAPLAAAVGPAPAAAAAAAPCSGPNLLAPPGAAAADDSADPPEEAAAAGDAIAPLGAWRAALQQDLAAADACLRQLVPGGGGGGGGKSAAAKAVGEVAAALGCGGWGAVAEGDDTAALADAGAARERDGGPTDWPAELWPLQRRGAGAGCGAAAAARGAAPPSWLSVPLRPQQRLAWLLTAPPRLVGPVQMLLERALLEPLQERVRCDGAAPARARWLHSRGRWPALLRGP